MQEHEDRISNLLQKIKENFETTPSKPSLKNESAEKSLSGKKSQKKEKKLAYVSNYVAFGSGESSEESSEDEEFVGKKVNFSPSCSNFYEKSCNLPEEAKEMEGKTGEVVEMELLLNYERNKANNLEITLKEKEAEIENFKNLMEELHKTIKEKEQLVIDKQEELEKMMKESDEIKKDMKNYQNLIKEFEDYFEKNQKSPKAQESDPQITILQKEISELHSLIATKDGEIEYLRSSFKELSAHNAHLSEFFEKHQEKLKCSDKKSQEDIKSLIKLNKSLEKELKKRSQSSSIRETERKLSELEKQVHDFLSKKPKPALKFSEKLLSDLLSLLKLSKPSQILPKVQDLLKPVQKSPFSLSKSLKHLILKFSPPGCFSKIPNDKKVYNWISRLIEEYLLKLKEHEFNQMNLQAFSQAMRLLNVTFPEDLISKLTSLVNKNNI